MTLLFQHSVYANNLTSCSSSYQVFVILFGVGERDTEGIYSLRAIGDDGLPTETIISFENEEDAQQ